LLRLKLSFELRNNRFYEKAEGNPDVYGPFWIAATLVLALTFIGNLVSTFESSAYETDYTYLMKAVIVVYTYTFGMPTVAYFIWKCTQDHPVDLIEVIFYPLNLTYIR